MSLRHPLANRTRGCARNPLRRRLDDVETMIMVGLVVLFLVIAPLLCIVTGRLADEAGLREQRAEQAWRPVTAVLVQSAAQGLAGQDAAWGAAWVKARWHAQDGQLTTGTIAVDLSAKAGQKVTIWVTRSGQVTHPPLSHGEVLDGVANAAMATAAGAAALFALGGAVIRAAVNRRRMDSWARDWDVVGPRWTSLR
ncbi:MAG TPA: hypothetical protein VEV45_21340 [Streptosporangiaceae bacterium]|nr:hypothetical protein [Streptosporangiaceae bacterium]